MNSTLQFDDDTMKKLVPSGPIYYAKSKAEERRLFKFLEENRVSFTWDFNGGFQLLKPEVRP